MDWDDLRFFLAVAEGGSLQAAARKLGVNHSTVFRRINRFEKEVQARLFERLADGYQLTTAGEDLLDHVRQIGNEVDQLSLKVLGKDYRPSGKVRLTAPDNLAYRYLPGYLLEFSKRYPDIRLEIVVSAESLDLTRREADVAVRATSAPPPHLVGRKVVTVQWAYYAAKAYLKGRRRPTSVGDLTGRRLIGADGALRRLPPFRNLEGGHAQDIVMTCSTLDAMSAMAEAGLGIALLPDDQRKPSLVRLFEAQPPYANDIWLLTHPELRRTERIRLLLEHLAESFRGDERLNPVPLTPRSATRK
jgi:DNA-binding transcriptional LysR family regulator